MLEFQSGGVIRAKECMNPSQDQKLDFKLIRCPACQRVLFEIAGMLSTFRIRIKCRNCSTRRRSPVFIDLQISFVEAVVTILDSAGDNFASAQPRA